jgi:hypothetical protein
VLIESVLVDSVVIDSDVGGAHEAVGRGLQRSNARPAARSAAISVAVYVALSVAIFWNIWSSAPTSVSQPGGDQFGAMWFLQWVPFALLHGHSPFFSDFSNSPFGVNLLTNTSVPLLGLVASPITLLWGSVLSFNLLMTLALPASATAGYFFANRWISWRPAAFVAGLLYGFSPYEIAQSSGHLNLTFVALPPLILLAVHELLVRQQGSRQRWGIILGLLVTAQFFISSEILVSTVVMGCVCVVIGAIVGFRSAAARLGHAVTGLAWAGGTAVILLGYPVWFMLRGSGHISGPIQLVPQGYRADLLGPFVPDSVMRLAPSHFAHIADNFANSVTENGSYLGITLVVALVVGACALWRGSPTVRVAVLAGLVAFIISLGAGLVVKGSPPGTATGFPLPERVLAKLPLLNNTIPVRYSLYVALFAALVLAVILDRIHAALSEVPDALRPGRRAVRGRRRFRAAAIPAALAVFALFPLVPVAPLGAVGPVGTPPYGSTAVIFPFPTSATPNAQLWQAASNMRFRMPGGYFLVPQGPGGSIAFSPALGYTRTTLTATVLSDLYRGTPPPETPQLQSAIMAQFRGWHVRTLIAFPTLSSDPARSTQFFTWLLGRTPVAQPGAASVWYHIQ